MNKADRNLIPILFVLLLLINAFLRFYEIDSFSLSNDELSGYFRAQYDNLSDLIRYGVIATDPHPAGVQIFLYYWIRLADSALILRIPFVLSSLASLVFIFYLFKSWMGEQRALLAISMYSLMEFTLIHGQLARPYAIGILTVSAFAWSWNCLVNERKLQPKYVITFIISAALSCYVHYYAALMVGIIALTGIIPAFKKGFLLPYLLFGLVSVLLFLPHINITIAQLSKGPLTNWIDPPDGNFLLNHIYNLLNDSIFILGIILILLIVSIYNLYRTREDNWNTLIYGLIFFLGPILTGLVYSYFFGSALMDRVLYFSAPFFFVLPVLAIPKMKNSIFLMVFTLVTAISFSTTIGSGVFLERQYVENFQGISNDITEAIANEKSINNSRNDEELLVINEDFFLQAGNYNSPDYLNFYRKKPLEFDVWDIDNDQKLANYMQIVRKSNKKAMILSWACKYQPIAAIEYAKRHYPNLVAEKSYYNSGFWELNKTVKSRDTLLYEIKYIDSLIDGQIEYIDLIKLKGNENNLDVINVNASFESVDVDGILLVYSLTSKTGESKIWKGHHFSDFAIENGKNEIFTSFKLPKKNNNDDVISIYIWNSKSKNLRLNRVEISSFSDSKYPGLY